MTQTTRLDYLRHGEPEGGSRYRGHAVDDPLSNKGWAQMRATVEDLLDWDRILSSPMQRCLAFAEWLGEQRNLPVGVMDPLKEVGFGAWEGKTRADLLAERPDEYHAFYADPVNRRTSGAEDLNTFGSRVAQAYEQIAATYPGEHVLVVAHAGVIRATLGHVLASPAAHWYRAAVDNAAISRFEHVGTHSRILCHNWLPRL